MSAQKVDKNLLLHLLTENDLTSREIAKRVGCSAERIRQLALKLLGRTGHQIRRERRELKLQENFERNEFVKQAKRRGLKVEPSKRTSLDWYKKELYVNGKFCLLRRAYDNVGHKGRYTAIRKPWQRAEICVMELGKGKFLIIPMKKMPRSATMFSVDDADSRWYAKYGMIGANTLITGRRLIRKMPVAKIVSEFVAFTETNGCDKRASALPAIDF